MFISLGSYLLLSLLGFINIFIGHIILENATRLLSISTGTKSYNLILIQRLANHSIIGILLALIGFIALFSSIFAISIQLHKYWFYINRIIKYVIIIWIFILVFIVISNIIWLNQILTYIFVFSLTIVFIYFMIDYFMD